MACTAFVSRLSRAWRSRSGSASRASAAGSKSASTSSSAQPRWRAPSATNARASSTTARSEMGRGWTAKGCEKSSMFVTIWLRLRELVTMWAAKPRRLSSGSRSRTSSEAKPSMLLSGLRISWATCAVIWPRAASLSARSSRSWSPRNSVRSLKISTAPTRRPRALRMGATRELRHRWPPARVATSRSNPSTGSPVARVSASGDGEPSALRSAASCGSPSTASAETPSTRPAAWLTDVTRPSASTATTPLCMVPRMSFSRRVRLSSSSTLRASRAFVSTSSRSISCTRSSSCRWAPSSRRDDRFSVWNAAVRSVTIGADGVGSNVAGTMGHSRTRGQSRTRRHQV